MTKPQIDLAIYERDSTLIKLFGLEWFIKQRKIKPVKIHNKTNQLSLNL